MELLAKTDSREKEIERVLNLARRSQGEIVVVHSYFCENVRSGCFNTGANYYHTIKAGVIDGEAEVFDASPAGIGKLIPVEFGIPVKVPVKGVRIVEDKYSPLSIPMFRPEDLAEIRISDEPVICLTSFMYCELSNIGAFNYYVGNEELRRFKLLFPGWNNSREDFISYVRNS